MSTKWLTAFSIGAVLASSSLLAQETLNVVPLSSANAIRVSNPSPANLWRYKFHNGRWWYYGRNSQWSYWNGNAWMKYQLRMSVQPTNRQFQPGDYERRPANTIQEEKNDARVGEVGSLERRPANTIQEEKNDARAVHQPLNRRPAGTIQWEKNNPRGVDED